MRYDARRDVYIEVQRPGIWAAMLAKAWEALEVTYGKALNKGKESRKLVAAQRPQQGAQRKKEGTIRIWDIKQNRLDERQQDDETGQEPGSSDDEAPPSPGSVARRDIAGPCSVGIPYSIHAAASVDLR